MKNIRIIVLFWISCLGGYAIGETIGRLIRNPEQSWIMATTPLWLTVIIAVLVFFLYKAIMRLQEERTAKFNLKYYKPEEYIGLNIVEDMRK